MRIIKLYDGVVESIGPIDWDHTHMQELTRNDHVSIVVNATFVSLRVRYKCMLTVFGSDIRSCHDVIVQAKSLLMEMVIVHDTDSGAIHMQAARTTSGRYVIRALISGNPQEGPLPEGIREPLADYISNLVNKAHLSLKQSHKCL